MAFRRFAAATVTATGVCLWARRCAARAERTTYDDLEAALYRGITDEYNELGQVERDEARLTVLPDAFTQIGVLTVAGVRDMVARLPCGPLRPADVFCDLGSGVGNICMQVLADTDCSHVVGVELLPSRQCHAREAYAIAKTEFRERFEGKTAAWPIENVASCGPSLRREGATVVFTHSWMFDDDLCARLGAELAGVPSLRCVVSSRPLPGLERLLPQQRRMAFEADWNPESPFVVYTTSSNMAE